MRLYTKAPNQNSTIKIQYPAFYGSKAEEINSLILAKVQDMASLDPSLFPAKPEDRRKLQPLLPYKIQK